jgi:hypothetical protein
VAAWWPLRAATGSQKTFYKRSVGSACVISKKKYTIVPCFCCIKCVSCLQMLQFVATASTAWRARKCIQVYVAGTGYRRCARVSGLHIRRASNRVHSPHFRACVTMTTVQLVLSRHFCVFPYDLTFKPRSATRCCTSSVIWNSGWIPGRPLRQRKIREDRNLKGFWVSTAAVSSQRAGLVGWCRLPWSVCAYFP